MDAIEFVQQLRRMDKSVIRKYSVFDDSPEDVVAEVKEWAKMNPIKTRQSVFLEQWPEAELYSDGVLGLCPKKVSIANRNNDSRCATISCSACRREFWMQEAE